MHADDLTLQSHIPLPTKGRRLLDRDTGGDRGGQYLVTVLRALLLKEFPRRHTHHARFYRLPRSTARMRQYTVRPHCR